MIRIEVIMKETPMGSGFHKWLRLSSFILSFMFYFGASKGMAQNSQLTINPTLGISWRSTAMNFFNFRAVEYEDYTLMYNYEKNVQGLALNPGMQVNLFPFGFEYNARLRHDYIHGNHDILNRKVLPDTKGFLLDHNFNLYIKRNITCGAGFSIVNSGTGYWFENPVGTRRFHRIEFSTYNVFVGFPVKKIIDLEIKAQYVPNDFPSNRKEEYIMYSLRAYYTFDLFKNEDH